MTALGYINMRVDKRAVVLLKLKEMHNQTQFVGHGGRGNMDLQITQSSSSVVAVWIAYSTRYPVARTAWFYSLCRVGWEYRRSSTGIPCKYVYSFLHTLAS